MASQDNFEIRELLQSVERTGQLNFNVRIEENQRFASLDLDLKALEPILFAGRIAEFIYCYATYLAGESTGTIYPDEVFRSFEIEVLREVRRNMASLADLCEYQGERYRGIFLSYLGKRNPDIGITSLQDVMRLEMVGIEKINPTVLKILATFAATAGMVLVLVFGGVQGVKQYQAPHCVAQQSEYAEEKTKAIMKAARLEGKLTEQHQRSLDKIDDSLKAGIAACYPDFTSLGIGVTKEGITIDAGQKEKPKAPK